MSTPQQLYQRDLDANKIIADEVQIQALAHLQKLYEVLLKVPPEVNNWRTWLSSALKKDRRKFSKGLYLWGGVGIGKTYLMDIFFSALPFKTKLRLHFHRFMQQVHAELSRLQGHADPLKIIARHFSMRARVLCIDEFMVHDIADAMILAGLFEALFECGICLVTTSNQPPDDLYENGLQRQRFLPAIELLKKNMRIHRMPCLQDYRLRALTQLGAYFTPLNTASQQAMRQCFEVYAHHSGRDDEILIIAQRPIKTICLAKQVVWFDFKQLCQPPRSQMDYLAIAERFKVVLVSNVPQIKAQEADKITYLINLVDIFYDQGVHLILSAQVTASALYLQGSERASFQRTLSRLHEMQSQDYLKRISTLIWERQ
ncbi:MAG: cell division protein ZapE [Gammaproteobacteria bacterium]